MLLVVAVAGKLILVGVSSHRVEKIADLEQSEEEYIEAAFGAARSPQKIMPFSDILSSIGVKKQGSPEIQKEDVQSDSSNQEDETNTDS
jgi:flagellar biogenesis protein FliO